MKKFKNYLLIGLIGSSLIITSCGDDDEVPPEEDELEVITDVTLVFTNTQDPTNVVRASAVDSDGVGITEELEVVDGISLIAGATYTLTFEILNNEETPADNIGLEILGEDDEHQFFFGFTSGAFASPTGNGNTDGAATGDEAINYEDEDSDAQDGSGNPVGLVTTWTAGDAQTGSTFRVVLMHQPPLPDGTAVKTATSGLDDGEDDFDLTFDLTITQP